MHNAPDIPNDHFFAMTRLDQNRAQFQLAHKAGVDITEVEKVTIWGNHSATQVPDFVNATIRGKKATDIIKDRAYLEGDFVTCVQKRGAAVIGARGKSSAASAANAILDGVRSILTPTKGDSWYSMCVLSNGNPYGIKDDLIFSFPCRTLKENQVNIVKGLEWDAFLKERIAETEKELLEERDAIAHLLK